MNFARTRLSVQDDVMKPVLRSIVDLFAIRLGRAVMAAAVCISSAAVLPPAAFAQKGSDDRYPPEALRGYFDAVIKEYEVRVGDEALKLQPQPVMHWQNSERSQEQGSMYVFLAGTRPQALVSIFTYDSRSRVFWRHELISLSDQPLKATWNGATVWTPREGGVKWQSLSEAPQPAGTAPRRLTQMRAIVRQFSGSIKSPTGELDSQLKLIPQPLLRYQSPPDGIIDGAVFSLAVVTDPEIFLIVEAIDGSAGQSGWRWAAVRAHYWGLSLERGGKPVWQAEQNMPLERTKANQPPEALGSYFLFTPADRLPPADQLP